MAPTTTRMTTWLSGDKDSVPPVMKTKNPAKIMVFGLISSDGKAMLAYIFPLNFRLNTEGYLELFERVVMPWLASTYPPDTKFM